MAKILLFYANTTTVGNRPISLSVLAGVVKKAGHVFKLFDPTLYSIGYAKDMNKVGEETLEFKMVKNSERLPSCINISFEGMMMEKQF